MPAPHSQSSRRSADSVSAAAAWLARAAVGCAVAGGLGCGGAERDGGWDRMEFAEESAEDGVADSALEPIGRVRVPVRPKNRPARAASGLGSPDAALPPPRCSNDSERTGPSRSTGQVTAGGLENGCRMAPSGPGFVAVNRNSWGTDETISLLQLAARQQAQEFPGSPPLVIGAISKQDGGNYPPHKSHQSGRDVDIGYPHTGRVQPRQFMATDAGNIDTERLWSVLESWLSTGRLSFVFMDYDLQAVLYQDLQAVGYSEAQLDPIFQYPAGPAVARGLVRHAAGHADHFHVRFRCPDSDKPVCQD